MVNFTIAGSCGNGSSATVTITYPTALPGNAQFWKYERTTAIQTDHWYQLTLTSNNLQISGNSVGYTLVDGGNGDDDFTVNGVIVDPVAVALPDAGAVAAIPAMSDMGLLVLAMLLACGAFFGYRCNDM